MNPVLLRPPRTKASAVWLPGSSGAYVSSPDSAALSVTGDMTLDALVQLTSYAAGQTLISKFTTGAGNESWRLIVTSGNLVNFRHSNNGSSETSVNSSVTLASVGIAAGQLVWIRGTRRSSDGKVQIYYATPADAFAAPSFTQLGTDLAGLLGAMFDSATPVELGTDLGGTNAPTKGRLLRARIYDGYQGAGNLKADVDFRQTIYKGQRSYTDAQGNVWTLNGAAVAQ